MKSILLLNSYAMRNAFFSTLHIQELLCVKLHTDVLQARVSVLVTDRNVTVALCYFIGLTFLSYTQSNK